ncbi:MAG: hypothetical protein NZM04_00820 [Methylacidiphilales bacterium]|nr:hypothetical protein [Candidatus Methylacidiphilales bacterium]
MEEYDLTAYQEEISLSFDDLDEVLKLFRVANLLISFPHILFLMIILVYIFIFGLPDHSKWQHQ